MSVQVLRSRKARVCFPLNPKQCFPIRSAMSETSVKQPRTLQHVFTPLCWRVQETSRELHEEVHSKPSSPPHCYDPTHSGLVLNKKKRNNTCCRFLLVEHESLWLISKSAAGGVAPVCNMLSSQDDSLRLSRSLSLFLSFPATSHSFICSWIH